MKYNRTLVIDRKIWLRGHADGKGKVTKPVMLNKDGNQCCLGFDAIACGVSKKSILNIGTPQRIKYEISHTSLKNIQHLILKLNNENYRHAISNTNFTQNAVRINDDTMSEFLREKDLTKLFATIKVKLEFIN